jgi:hypothetical protein
MKIKQEQTIQEIAHELSLKNQQRFLGRMQREIEEDEEFAAQAENDAYKAQCL